MSEVTFVFDQTLVYERIVTDVEMHSGMDPEDRSRIFMKEAAIAIAEKLLANGCLIHHSEYDIERKWTRESISLIVGRRDRELP